MPFKRGFQVLAVRVPAWGCMEPHARSLWNRPAVLRRTMQRLPVYSRIASEAGKQAYKPGHSRPSVVLSFSTESIWHSNLLSRLLYLSRSHNTCLVHSYSARIVVVKPIHMPDIWNKTEGFVTTYKF
jgi:hypothetical protein